MYNIIQVLFDLDTKFNNFTVASWSKLNNEFKKKVQKSLSKITFKLFPMNANKLTFLNQKFILIFSNLFTVMLS